MEHSMAQKTIIKGHLRNRISSKDTLVVEYQEDYLAPAKVAVPIDSYGKFEIGLELNQTALANFTIDTLFFQAYLYPGVTIDIDASIQSRSNLNNSIIFKGGLSNANQAIFNVIHKSPLASLHWSTGEKLAPDDLIKKIADYYSLKQRLLKDSSSDKKMTRIESDILKTDSISDEYSKAGAFLTILKRNGLTKDKARKFVKENITPKILSFPDPGKTKIPEVSSFWTYAYLYYLIDRDADTDSDLYKKHSYNLLSLNKIDGLYKGPIKDYAKAALLYNLLYSPSDYRAGTDSLIMLTESFITNAGLPAKTKSVLHKKAQSINGGIFAFKKNSPAPEFTAHDLNGKALNFTKFKNKLLLLDIWASWCAPCIAQAANLERLKEKYKGSNIEFLMVSVDVNPEYWKRAIKKYNLKGYQFNVPEGLTGDFGKNYYISNIPRYILIKNSIILNGNAPFPDDSELINEINRNLK